MDSSPGSIWLELGLIIFLIILNAFFAASEIAIISLNKTKLNLMGNEGDKKASLLIKLLDEPSKLLATIQIGVTLAGFFASASAATTISKPVAQFFKNMNFPGSDKVSLILVTIVLSYLTLVFGELFPKRIALQYSESIAKFAVRPIIVISAILLPFVKVLTSSTNLLVRILGIRSDNLEEMVSEEEIRMMIHVGEENGVINETEKEMIDGIFEFDNTLAKEIMTPRTDVFAVDIETPINEIIDSLIEEQYSRVPVYENDIDNIIGILYIKDIIPMLRTDNLTTERLKSLIRVPYFVPETKNIDTLFKELQSTKNYLALLIDEYGGFSGIVTMEDLIEEVMGNIFDEYDDSCDIIKKVDNSTYFLDGSATIDDINETLDLQLPSDNFDTISGFVLDILGSIPKEDEEVTVEYENLVFKVTKIEEKRIRQLLMYIG